MDTQKLAALLSRLLTETVDNTATAMVMLDTQARILAHLERRDADAVVDEISAELKSRRRELLRELDTWMSSLSPTPRSDIQARSEEHTSELQSRGHLVCRRLL